jgi:competence ComEA-like helix-hairpin-helix protein
MGLQDRDYMHDELRRRLPPPPPSPPPPRTPIADWIRSIAWRRYFSYAVVAIAVTSAALWLLREMRPAIPDVGPDKGSLIVNINTASQEELETLPGIGPVRAAQIIAGRPYATIDDLEKIRGISAAHVDELRPFIKTEGETSMRDE